MANGQLLQPRKAQSSPSLGAGSPLADAGLIPRVVPLSVGQHFCPALTFHDSLQGNWDYLINGAEMTPSRRMESPGAVPDGILLLFCLVFFFSCILQGGGAGQ